MNSITYFLLTSYTLNHVFKSFQSLYNENEKFHEIFQRRSLEIFQNLHEIFEYFKVKYFIVHGASLIGIQELRTRTYLSRSHRNDGQHS